MRIYVFSELLLYMLLLFSLMLFQKFASGPMVRTDSACSNPPLEAHVPQETQLQSTHAGGTRPYGVDPSFNMRSTLYRFNAMHSISQFYNSSRGSLELSNSGAPFAFYPRHTAGYEDGFPVFFPVCINSSFDVLKLCACM